jgi:hypothetical protein
MLTPFPLGPAATPAIKLISAPIFINLQSINLSENGFIQQSNSAG